MTTEQKLREVVIDLKQKVIELCRLCNCPLPDWSLEQADKALATTEPEPTGIPELPEPDIHYIYIGLGWKPATAQQYAETHRQKCAMHSTIQLQTYGEKCWKAGYKHGAWGDKPAVNQQLTTEPLTNDTKDALMAGRAYAQEALIRFDDAYDRHPSTEPERNAILADIQLIDAAMAQGVK